MREHGSGPIVNLDSIWVHQAIAATPAVVASPIDGAFIESDPIEEQLQTSTSSTRSAA